MLVDRFDKYDVQIRVGDILRHEYGKLYKVVFSEDILAVGIVSIDDDLFEFMAEWVADEWEVVGYED